ncbi:hypothetical protein [Allostreptomyces psammosilenae]|uniref:Uncharacterized protein n=1 Tax=Allostreptomyces psammosilenae TaxID=1892865 RepID=A0A853A5U0_9ACTN|nr:hypothetical protein [Allostreptomyces psammosilenae]NYI05852.1 hypothetical protein [Allostreptomyces psammosilenae]
MTPHQPTTTGGGESWRSRWNGVLVPVMNDERRYRRLRATRARRRTVVLVEVALLLTTFGVMYLPRPALWLMALTVPAYVVCTGVLNLSTRGLMELPWDFLDERQRDERLRATRTAHRLTTPLLLLTVVAAWLLGDSTGGPLGDRGISLLVPLLLAAVLLQRLLPLLVAAWHSTDPLPPEELDG